MDRERRARSSSRDHRRDDARRRSPRRDSRDRRRSRSRSPPRQPAQRDARRERSRDARPKDRGPEERGNRELAPPKPSGKGENPNLMPLVKRGEDGFPVAAPETSGPPVEKEKPNYGASGLLAAEQNSYKGVVVKYAEPPEARKPSKKWRLYVFKGKDQIDMIPIHSQSAYLIGREKVVVDIAIEHPSCSKQHAAIQFRQIVEKNDFGDTKRTTKPYIIDLESTNGVFVNGEQIPAARFYELQESDVIKFGMSTREYVLMSEESAA